MWGIKIYLYILEMLNIKNELKNTYDIIYEDHLNLVKKV